ncbi:succinylglutamate desuccinylase/aspartoacylase family protein [Rhizobium mayense]|uniref:Succinylglutamate desuccinylase/aspartoacylase family protein n=1 Tax=Rhizobium mayense TaxID=1312184 RepID=A0ABT7JNJ7_9HYPH|nr:succinylglutamate desuccinylase/aspartoacylase family protein [Rhizobium mayense]MDL2397929.1 succinylglutamate desuccinylase/aspartoacylase family protein [Rhizobium mayense]
MNGLPAFKTGKLRAEFGHVKPIEDLEIPFGIIEGSESGPTLLITAGVHASEFCSIEAAVRLMQTKPEQIKGTLVVLPILNIEGFSKRSIYVMPQDGRNLNRMFPGNPEGTTGERLANWLMTSVYPQVNAYMDLHGGDLDESLAPFTIFPAGCEKSKALAEAFGLPIAVASSRPGNSVNGARQVGVPSILPEIGGNGLWNEDTVGLMVAGIHRVMQHLGMIADAPRPAKREPMNIFTMWVPTAPVTGLWYAKKELSETVAKGETLGEIRDVFGKVLATITSENDGFILYRMSSLSVNQGEALLGVGVAV